MSKKIDLILKEVLNNITPSEEESSVIKKSLGEFLRKIEERLKSLKVDAEIFVGGSYAKKTLIKRDKYDIDIFLRFDKKHKEDIQKLAEKILKDFSGISKVHGSRDYFNIKINPKIFFEIVPVLKIKNPESAENITDLSYLHVKYINQKIKSEKLLNEIRIAKSFCYANNCYGAESYIRGFSGYGLELLVYYYKSFLKFIRAIAKTKDNQKIIIDIEKKHKNKSEILMNLNSSKLQSPVILIDPTYKQRNVLAALSDETFRKFRTTCKNFLKNPSKNSFKTKKFDFEKIKEYTKEKNNKILLLKISTNKPEGDVAGSKLLKFYKHLENEIAEFFNIKNKGFEYDGKKSAKLFFDTENKKERIINGPYKKDKENFEKFKKKHKNIFEKSGKIYSKKKVDFKIKEFIEKWKNKNRERMKDMYIEKLEII
jgi:tRNA nucleotidyltransferase (CCA-adding enzyme)